MKKLALFLLLSIVLNSNAQTSITATIPFQGYDETQAYLGEAEFQIFLDNVDGVLDKPIILVDGFDPSDTRDIPAMYNLLSDGNQNLADTLRDEGYDFVLLNFPVYTRASDNVVVDGGVDYIQRNAMILTELIDTINNQKVGSEELVIIGPSMGGLISRYALRYMEQNSLDHQTRLYVSWDTPHQGANILIGFQYLFNYIAIQTNDQQLMDGVNASLKSPASKEMLVDHFLGHLQSGSDFEQDPNLLLPVGAPNFRDAFQNEIDAMGFPQQVRNISVSNGSGIGITTGSPGVNVINNTFDVAANTTSDVIINFTPVASQSMVVTDVITRFFGVPIATYTAESQSTSVSDGLDASPGGKYDIASFTNATQGNPILQDFITNLNQSEFCFIPTISSLAINNENNWYASPDIGNTHNSPFDAWYVPNANEDHVTLTQANINFVLPEIRNQVVGVVGNVLTNKYILKTNPVSNNITLLLDNSYQYNNVNTKIVDITGKSLLQNTYNSVSNEINIPIDLSKGIYFLTISDSQITFSKKIIVK